MNTLRVLVLTGKIPDEHDHPQSSISGTEAFRWRFGLKSHGNTSSRWEGGRMLREAVILT